MGHSEKKNHSNKYTPSRFVRNFDKYSEITYILLWDLTLWALFVAKVVSEGPKSYFAHYTNWNWAINMIYFTGDLLTRISKDKDVRRVYLGFLFWLAYGSNWSVFFLVFLIFQENPGLLTDLAVENGGKYGMGFLINMNTVFHSLPLVGMLMYTVLAKSSLSSMIFTMLIKMKHTSYMIMSVIMSFMLPIITISIYAMCVDFQQVYGITINVGYVILIVLGVVIVFNGFTMAILYSKAARREYNNISKTKKEHETKQKHTSHSSTIEEFDQEE